MISLLNRSSKIFAFFLCLLAAACSMGAEDEILAKSIFEQVRSGQFGEFESHLSENLRTPETRAVITKISIELIRNENPDKISLSGWTVTTNLGGRHISTVHLYEYPDRILTVSTGLSQPKDGSYLITNFNVNMTELNGTPPQIFSLNGKSPQQLAFVGFLVLSVAVMLTAFAKTLLAKNIKRKWLWAIAALAGAPAFVMNWNTGSWNVLATIGLINTGISRGLAPTDPWILQFQIPIGAVFALVMLAQRRTAEKGSDPTNAVDES